MTLTAAEAFDRLSRGLRSWFPTLLEHVKKVARTLKPKGGIWDRMPAIDSKVAMLSSPVFESVLGMDLDEKLVKPGGYPDIETMIDKLVPAMIEKARRAGVVVG